MYDVQNEGSNSGDEKYGDEYVAIESISYEMLERLEEYAPEIIYIETYHEQ
jgi:hypothetical protein